MTVFLLLILTLGAPRPAAQAAPAGDDMVVVPRNPEDSVHWAVSDCKALPAVDQGSVRYLSLYHVPAAERAAWKGRLDFTLNSLSRRRLIVPSVTVAGCDNTVLRLRLTDYGMPAKAWDDLAFRGSGPLRSQGKKEKAEPYFNLDTTDATTGKAKTVNAPWVGQEIVSLTTMTHSDFPILRGDWFLFHAWLPPAYYDFLGAATLADFQKLTRFRVEDSGDLAIQGTVIASEEVAINNRSLLRSPTVLGAYWESLDYKSSLEESDLLANLLNRKRDAGEIIANLPNGLQCYCLVDGDDKKIDFADPNVAVDRQTTWRNKLVWAGASCVMCHSQGIKPVSDEVRLLTQGQVALLVKEHKEYEKVQDLFAPDLDARIEADQEIYNRLVMLCSGLAAKANASAFARAFIDYDQEPVTLLAATRETGYPRDKITEVLKRGVNLDHTLTGLLAGRPVRRDQWEATAFPQLMLLLKQGAKP